MRALTPLLLALAAATAPALAQTLDERAAQVRETLGAPLPPIETVIDRGTRVIGSPVQPASAAERLLAPADLADQLNRQFAGGMAGTGADGFAGGQSAPMFSGTQSFPVWIKGAPPAFPAISRPIGGRVTGTSNLVTGNGTPR